MIGGSVVEQRYLAVRKAGSANPARGECRTSLTQRSRVRIMCECDLSSLWGRHWSDPYHRGESVPAPNVVIIGPPMSEGRCLWRVAFFGLGIILLGVLLTN